MTTHHSSLRPSIALAALLGASACTANPPAQNGPTAEAAPAPAPVAAPPVAPPAPAAPPTVARVEPTSAPAPLPPPPTDAAPPADAAPPPAEPGADAPPVDPAAAPTGETTGPAALVAAPIVAAEHKVTWRDVATLPADPPPRFHSFATGVLAVTGETFSTLDATGAWVPVTIEAPPGELSGHWPDEAWAVEHGTTRDREQVARMRLHRLRGGHRWVPQAIAGAQWLDTARLGPVRKSWQVGFLAVADDALVRVAGGNAAEPVHPATRGYLSDIVESKAGDLYTLARDGNNYYVQLGCADEACVQTNATPLPPGGWEWVQSIPRQKHSVSITLHDETNKITNHVLHYETGGWKLEVLPAGARFVGLWPTSDGGMWAQTAEGLLHRDPAGAWRNVALPAEVTPSGPVFAAMTTGMSELVIVGVRGGASVVLATPARAQAAG